MSKTKPSDRINLDVLREYTGSRLNKAEEQEERVGEKPAPVEEPKKEDKPASSAKPQAKKEKQVTGKQLRKQFLETAGNEKRQSVTFHMFAGYSEVIDRVGFIARIRTKGQVLEMIINKYLDTLSDDELKELFGE